MKKDFTPTLLDFGSVRFLLARHFGFCYGVENAIEIAFRTVDENPGKRIFLLSEMIHNPSVNADLISRGVRFLQNNEGEPLIPFEELRTDDIVIIPAFGTTLDIEKQLLNKGIPIERYNTTCPFVEKVWNRSQQIAQKNYTVVVHGKPTHEETRATFSHAAAHTPTIVINDMKEAKILADFITGNTELSDFSKVFGSRCSNGFDPENDLKRIGVVNQTTMLASDTQAIADFLKQVMMQKHHAAENIADYFADTRDTLCYATNDNQSAIYGLLEEKADIAIVVGGYNSSNTSHLVELCEEKLPTYYIDHHNRIQDRSTIHHFDFHHKLEKETVDFLPKNRPTTIAISSGASCPDAIVEGVIRKIAGYYVSEESIEATIATI